MSASSKPANCQNLLLNLPGLILLAQKGLNNMNMINQVKQLVSEINRLHSEFSKDYFETGKIEKINLSRTIRSVPVPHIYNYRLNLHEAINDYLMNANIEIKYFYRVKTRESIDDKIERFSSREDQYPVNNWLNDIFGARVVVSADDLKIIMDLLDDWQDELNLKNWYLRDGSPLEEKGKNTK